MECVSAFTHIYYYIINKVICEQDKSFNNNSLFGYNSIGSLNPQTKSFLDYTL